MSPKARRIASKALHLFTALVMVLNVTTAGFLVNPQVANAASPSANLDQCANDPAPSPSTNGCSTSATEWVNGNLGASKSVYYEGDSIPYRMVFGDLSLGSHTVTIEWDTTKSGKHAIDYLTTYNRSVTTADPTLGIAGLGAPTTFAIPADPQVTGAGVTPITGNFTLYGGTITAASAYSYSNGAGFAGDKSASITLTFTASVANPVLAWGGHISHRGDWGTENSAVAIPGSPYHTRLINLDGSGGNQDRSLSADAVIYPASITVVKDANPNGSQSFNYTTTGGLSPANFSLVDDGTTANTRAYTGITNFTTYTVTESALAGWTLAGITCVVTSPNGGSQTVNKPSVSISLKEGENVTCTYTNNGSASLNIKKYVRKVSADANVASNWYNWDVAGQILTVLPGETVEYKVITWNSGTAPGTATVVDATSNSTIYNPTYTGGTLFSSVSIPNQNGAAMPSVTTAAGDGAYWKIVTYQKQVDATTATSGTTSSINTVTLNGTQTSKAKIQVTYACDLRITKSVDSVDTQTNSIIYKLDYQNIGTADCTGGGVRIDDAIPTNTSYANWHAEHSADTNEVKFGYEYAKFGTTNTTGYNGSLLSWNARVLNPQETGWVKFKVNVRTLQECEELDILNKGKIYSNEIPDGIWSNEVSTHFAAPCTTTIKVIKHVINDNGGTKTASNFTLHITGTAGDYTFNGSEAGQTFNVVPGTFTVSEDILSGYAMTMSGDCSGSIALGQDKVCTVTNDDIAPKLKLVKTVINNNGGTLQVADFPLFVNGNSVTSGQWNTLTAGVKYTATETNQFGYQASVWGTDCAANGTITLQPGEEKVCTITNDDIQPKLIVTKHVINNNGGTAVAADFTLNVTGISATPSSFTGNEAGTEVALNAGAYNVDENAFTGYAKTLGTDCSGTISVGETKYCTVTNDDIAPKLKLVKTVINNNGGTKQVSDFPLFVNGNSVTSGQWNTLTAGVEYIATETSDKGYQASIWGGDCSDNGTITLQPGDQKICTITNDDIQPKLTVTKIVTNDNGGTAVVSDFPLYVDQTQVTSGVQNGFDAKSYIVSETSLPGYTATISGDCDAQGNVTLLPGDEKSCTITNDDQTAHLTLIKYVTNDDGGLSTAGDWLLSSSGPTSLSDYGTADGDVNTGTYALSEQGPTGYDASDWICRGGIQDEDTITLALGESATCTITNDDIAGKIWGYKYDDNNGNGQYDQDDQAIEGWTIFLKQAGQTIGTVQTNSNGYYEFTDLSVGNYSVVENMLTGWVPVSDQGYDFSVVPGYTHQFDFLNYQLGTISGYKFEDVNGNGNWDQDEPAIADWTINLSGSATDTQKTDGNGYYEFTNLAIGSYTVSEEMQSGWTNTTPDSIAGLQILNSGTNLTSNTFGNFKLGKIAGYKFEDMNGNGTWDQGEPALDGWEICIDEEEECVITGSGEWQTGYYEFTGLEAGTYCLSEEIQDGWVQMAAPSKIKVISGTNSTDNNFGNTELSTITATKLIDADGDLESDEDQTAKEGWTVQLWKGDAQFGDDQTTDVNGQYTWKNLMPGTYTVKEVFDTNEFTALTNTEYTIEITSGDEESVTFINFENIDVTVCKYVDLNGDGDLEGDSLYTGGWDMYLNEAKATTDDKGCYTYANLGPGSYDLSEASDEGWMQTYPVDPDEYEFDAVSGQNVRYDFGNFELGKISGYKFEDIDRSGTWNNEEGGLAGWTINLWDESDGQPDEIIASTITDENGYYEFSDLEAGTYFLSENLTDGWVQTYPVAPGIHGPIVVTSGYDNGNQEEYFLFGNAEKITLHVNKTTDKPVVEATETVNYRIDWSVSGNSIATNVTLVDTIPTQLNINLASISDGGVWDATARTITWSFGDQQPNASGFVTYTANIVIPIANGTPIVNVAKLSADNSDPLFDEDDATVTVTSAPKLTIDKSVNVTTFVNPKAVVTYTVVIDNVGTDTAIATMLADALPAGFTFVDTGLGTKTWSLGDLAPADAPITITYQVKVGADVEKGFYDNLAVTWASNHPSISDKATVEVRVPTVLAEEADPVLIIQKSVNKEFINPGDKVIYTVKVTNIGDAQAEAVAINVRIQDILPSGFTFEDGSLTKVFQLGDIMYGESKTITYTAVSSKSVLPGDYENVAIAWADNHGKISDFAVVEVRKPQVLGAEALPTTGGGMLVWLYGLVALSLLAFAGWVLRLTFDRNEN
ncbi:MAG: DUF11 domain-containing protein [Candidatus Kerfeldbacteria bacterium]|nr:DUF11 domain-containing protein [Candidatus Kerfeldbacteria bacterium]